MFGSRVADPVEGGQDQVGAGGDPAADPGVAQHTVDHGGGAQPLEDPPHRGHVPEPAVQGVVRQRRVAACRRQAGDHFGFGAQVDLLDDPGLPAYPGRCRGVEVGVFAAPLLDDRSHLWGIHPPALRPQGCRGANPQARAGAPAPGP